MPWRRRFTTSSFTTTRFGCGSSRPRTGGCRSTVQRRHRRRSCASICPSWESQTARPRSRLAATKLQERLNKTTGPLLRAMHVEYGDNEPGRLVLVIHHLAVDGVSWRILLEDLETAYLAVRDGAPVELPSGPRPTTAGRSNSCDMPPSAGCAASLDRWSRVSAPRRRFAAARSRWSRESRGHRGRSVRPSRCRRDARAPAARARGLPNADQRRAPGGARTGLVALDITASRS